MASRALQGNEVILAQRYLYLLPTGAGIMFALILFVMLMAGINYGNGMIYMLTFFLTSVAIVSMLVTHRNLHKLVITPGHVSPVFAGQHARFNVCFQSVGRDRYGIVLEAAPGNFPGYNKHVLAEIPALEKGRSCHVLTVPVAKRGYQALPPFKVSTRFPFGLLYSWSRRIELDQCCLVYPRPAAGSDLNQRLGNVPGQIIHLRQEGDDFAGLRTYRTGDPPRHVHWKSVAKGQQKRTKIFAGQEKQSVWLRWEDYGGDAETRLSRLCRDVLDAEHQGLLYGLGIPGKVIEPGRGQRHQHRCLKALALWQP